jgi:hypothetical protein
MIEGVSLDRKATIYLAYVFILVVLYAGCDESCWDGLELDPDKKYDSFSVSDLISDDGTTRVRVVKRYLGQAGGGGFSWRYDLVRFGYADTSEVFCSRTGLNYINSHHNSSDVMQATYDDKLYELRKTDVFGYDDTWILTLTISDERSGDLIEGPIPLEFDGCYVISHSGKRECDTGPPPVD